MAGQPIGGHESITEAFELRELTQNPGCDQRSTEAVRRCQDRNKFADGFFDKIGPELKLV
jgi:hypothetical protein